MTIRSGGVRDIRNTGVAVVGGAGFLGSHLVNHLIEDRNCSVTVIDNLCAGRREFVHKKADFVYADITQSENLLYRAFRERATKFVFNYAAWPYVPDSYSRPAHVFSVNAMGALHVINAAQEAGVQAILQVSSAEVYGDGSGVIRDDAIPQDRMIDEDCRVIPYSSYGASKAAIDALVQVRWWEARTPCIALRQFNCLGERETHPYVITEIISQLNRSWDRKGQPGTVFVRLGNNTRRDFMYAGDAVRMAVELLEHGKFGEVYNLGSQESIKIYDLAKLIGEKMGFSDVKIETDETKVRTLDIWHLQSDNTKIHNTIRRRPQANLSEAIRRTIDWYEENRDRWPWESNMGVRGS